MMHLLIVLLIFAKAVDFIGTAPVKFCYYVHDDKGGLMPEDINGSLCTHIVYGFADIVNHTVYPRGKDANATRSVWRRVVDLKKRFVDLHVLLSIGATPKNFSETAAVDDTLNRFAQSAQRVIEHNGFDGLDIDWEFPVLSGLSWMDRANFIKLLSKLQGTFNRSIAKTGKHILLTAAVAAPFSIVEVSYDVPNMAKYLDYCLLMGYDFSRYNPIFPIAEFNSPLFSHKGQVSFLRFLNLEYASNLWVRKGMPRSKIVVGIPFYSVMFKLINPAMHDVGAPVCKLILQNEWTSVFHNESQVPYAYHDEDWVTFDDVRSVSKKVDWIMDNNFAGVMTFDLGSDDHAKQCSTSGSAFPLQKAVDRRIKNRMTL
ncbi:acidic mammalian chitinase-like isoform X2 [Varroa destructor]|uniref:GH18 domain-containing protein n=1 Tax=Varroa destructor TaxID=109461 RepID=A0A7M7MGB3_VARDE|nr:acidic mammalian chitinase-like isoform X2 [Varroa destructor]